MALVLITVLVIEVFRADGETCGIPLYLWIEVFFIIWGSKSVFDLNLIWIVRYRHRWIPEFLILSFLITCAALAGWTIYGYCIYFSDNNDC